MVKVFCKSLAIFVLVAGTVWCRAQGNDPVVARYHFIGTSQLTASNYNETRKTLNKPSSIEYRDLVLNRLSGQIAASIAPTKGQGAGNIVRPLIDDLLANESAGVFGVPGDAPEDFVIAVHLDKLRSVAWVQAIEKLADAPGTIRLQQEGEWTVVSRGSSLKSAEDKFLADIRSDHRPVPALKDSILEANIDWPRLSQLPALASFNFKPAILQIKVSPKGSHLRTEIHAHYPQPIAWRSQPWKLPTETIRDPLVSLSAGQNIAAFMKANPLADYIDENPLTNQFFLWANLNVPFETAALFPMKNAQRHLQSLGRELPSRVNPELKKNYDGELKWLEKTNVLIWKGMPIVTPYAEAIHEKAGDFMLLGTFVLAPGGPPAPAELWSQFKSRNDLVYYDWEISGPRIAQWRMLSPLLPIFPVARTNDTTWDQPHNKAAQHTPPAIVSHFLDGLVPALTPSKDTPGSGNVVTEVTRNGQSDYTIVRSSQLGLTAFETLLVSHWLADTKLSEVPKPDAPLPPEMQGLRRKPAKK